MKSIIYILFCFGNRPFPSLPKTPEIQHFLKTFKIQYFDVTDDECLKLCSILVEYQHMLC